MKSLYSAIFFVGITAVIGGFIYFFDQDASIMPFEIEKPTNVVQNNETTVASCGAGNDVIVTKVIDGDTVIVTGGYHVRLIGIDADEKGYECYKVAKERLETLVLGKNVILKRDVTDVDQYQRCLRNVFLGGQNIGVQLVKEGMVVARFYEPDVQYKREISVAEIWAIDNQVGCKWKK